MHLIDSDGATIDNKFTEGSAVLSIPATVVSAAIMNAIQDEIASTITETGIALLTSSTDTGDQLRAAIKLLIKRGGNPTTAPSFAVPNNQASFADVTGFPQLDTTLIFAVELFYRILLRTDSEYKIETGRMYITWNPETAAWELTRAGVHGDSETDFQMLLVSGTTWKLQFKSPNLAGASYAGTFKYTDIKEIR